MSEWMLWGRFGGSAQLGSAPPPRLYFIPISSSVTDEGPLAIALGHQNKNDRTFDDVARAIERAISGEFDGVIFPSAFLTAPFRFEVIDLCQKLNLKIVHQVTIQTLQPCLNPADEGAVMRAHEKLTELMRRLDAGDALNLVFGAGGVPRETLLARLTRWPDQVYFTYSVGSADPVIETLHLLQPFARERLFFHFPYHLTFGDGNLSCRQVFDLTERIRSRVPGIRVRPMLGTENFDPRVDKDLELEPLHTPRLQRSIAESDAAKTLEISVIIPSYNNRDYLMNTVKHLLRQDLPRTMYEVVVVDDGSNDGSEAALRDWLATETTALNLKYIYSPRVKPRKMGDANYRAGISRNLGVKNASGRIFCFLDSDILTPPNFLSDLVEKHKSFDVIQCKRLNLVRDKSNLDIRFEEVSATSDTFATEDGYWERFYALKNWSSEPFFWKYTCTYGLSVPAQLFKRVGWIRRGFVFYGFEDVELGYRLARVGARFHLNNVITYHLFHRNERSEFHNSDYLRQSLLAKTAQIFYLGLLEPEIYTHFRGLMKEQLPLFGFVGFAIRRLGLDKFAGRIGAALGKISTAVSHLTHAVFSPLHWTLHAIKKHSWRAKIPVLAVWNWRWFLWRQWGRVRSRLWLAKVPVIKAVETSRVVAHKADAIGWRARSEIQWAAGQSWRIRVALQKFIAQLELWRIPVFVRKVANVVALWRISVFVQRAVDNLQLWRIPVFVRKVANVVALWRISVFIQRAVAKLELWRIPVFLSNTVDAVALWKISVLLQRLVAKLELWRLRVLFLDAKAGIGLWRVSVLLKRGWAALALWRLRIGAEKALAILQVWRLKVWLQDIGTLLFWNLRSAIQTSIGQAWRLRVLATRLASHLELWRVRVAAQSIHDKTWIFRVMLVRLSGLFQFWRLRVTWLKFCGQSWRIRVLLQRGYALLWSVAWPIRKIYYFAAFQWSKLANGQAKEES